MAVLVNLYIICSLNDGCVGKPFNDLLFR